jgi:hypothetical protein
MARRTRRLLARASRPVGPESDAVADDESPRRVGRRRLLIVDEDSTARQRIGRTSAGADPTGCGEEFIETLPA